MHWMYCRYGAVCVIAGCDDLAAKENELDRLLSVCSSSINTLTKNVSSTQYPFNYFYWFWPAVVSCYDISQSVYFLWVSYVLGQNTSDQRQFYSVSQKKIPPPPPKFSDIFPKQLQIFSSKFYTPITRSCLRWTTNFIQLPATLTKLCHIKSDRHNVLNVSTIDRKAR